MNRSTSKDEPQQAKSGSSTTGLFGEILFDVPIYRLTKKEYESRQEASVEKDLSDDGPYVEEMYRRNPAKRRLMKERFRMAYGGPWQFNEISGFIRLYFFFTQIRGEYWCIDSQRITRTRRKVFICLDHKVTYEEEVPKGASNEQIFQVILKYLTRAKAERRLKGRYLDTSVLERIGPHINWGALIPVNSNVKPQ